MQDHHVRHSATDLCRPLPEAVAAPAMGGGAVDEHRPPRHYADDSQEDGGKIRGEKTPRGTAGWTRNVKLTHLIFLSRMFLSFRLRR